MLVRKQKIKRVYELRRRAPAAKTRRWGRTETSAVAPLDGVVLLVPLGLAVVLSVLDWGDKKVPMVDLRKFE